MKKNTEFLGFREYCISVVAQMFSYTDPVDRGHVDCSHIREDDLVVLGSAPHSIWGFSIVHEVHGEGNFCLRAVGTDELCDWSNVRLCKIEERYGKHPDLRWYPEQYNFWIKLIKSYRKAKIDRYDFSLVFPVFDDFKADVLFRCHVFRGETKPPEGFRVDDISKITIKNLAENIVEADKKWRSFR